MDGNVYNDRQMKDFRKIFIHPLDILKMGWLNLQFDSFKWHKSTMEFDSIGRYQRNRVRTPISFFIELTDQLAFPSNIYFGFQ